MRLVELSSDLDGDCVCNNLTPDESLSFDRILLIPEEINSNQVYDLFCFVPFCTLIILL